MGCFDTVIFRCPDCGSAIDEQTKAGECLLRDYSQESVPLEIAGRMDGDEVFCQECGSKWVIRPDDSAPKTVPLILVTP